MAHVVLWPDHCIQDSEGAAFHADLNVTMPAAVIRKGMRPQVDSYSAFLKMTERQQRVFQDCCGTGDTGT